MKLWNMKTVANNGSVAQCTYTLRHPEIWRRLVYWVASNKLARVCITYYVRTNTAKWCRAKVSLGARPSRELANWLLLSRDARTASKRANRNETIKGNITRMGHGNEHALVVLTGHVAPTASIRLAPFEFYWTQAITVTGTSRIANYTHTLVEYGLSKVLK